MNIQKTADNIWNYNKLNGSLSPWQSAEVKRMILAGIRAGIHETSKATLADKPKYILSRSWADHRLNSDDDLKYFPGKAVIR